jgi:hypothetical protein
MRAAILLLLLLLLCPADAIWSRRRPPIDQDVDGGAGATASTGRTKRTGDASAKTYRRRLVDETIGRSLPVDDSSPSARSHDEAAVSAGHHFTCSLSSRSGVSRGGTVRCFGHNSHGQTDAPPGIFQQVTSGASHSCAVAATGAVSCWGRIPPPPEHKSFVQISSGGDHVCGIQSTGGNILCWGSNHHGESDGSGAGPFVQVSSGQSYSCGLHRDGTAVCWGKNHEGQARPPEGVKFRQISAGLDHHVCGVTADEGSVRCWGRNSRGQAEDRHDGPYLQVAAGRRAACAIKEDTLGLVCWGGSSPVPAEDMTARRYKQISLGKDHACAIDVDRRLHCWQNGADLGGHNVPVGFLVGGEL